MTPQIELAFPSRRWHELRPADTDGHCFPINQRGDRIARLGRRGSTFVPTVRSIMHVNDIRNIAIIAHVDHGKTTLVDRLLQSTHAFRENQQVAERVLDSGDQERERGITILAKNISISWRDVKINVIDTPGHADFGGEVERVLKMADGCLLIVDAFEGPMPQTRFVLRHALHHGLKPMVVVNKIDRPGARPHEVMGDVFDLMVDLGANDAQLDFPIIYTSAVNGYARNEPDDGNDDMTPLLDAILEHIPAPDVDTEGAVAMQVCTIDYSDYVGRIGIGRIFSGTLHSGDRILVIKNDGSRYQANVKQLYTFEALGRVEAAEAHAGDICAVVGVDDADIGDIRDRPARPSRTLRPARRSEEHTSELQSLASVSRMPSSA